MRPRIIGLVVAILLLGAIDRANAALSGSAFSPAPDNGYSGGEDPMFSFTFSDLAGDTGTGTIWGLDNGNGSISLIGGSLSLTTPSDPSSSGEYSLLTPPSTTSPSGLFNIDNLIYPSGDAPGYIPPALLDVYGLLFGNGETEINIWGNGNDDYAIYAGRGGGYPTAQGSGGTFTLTPMADPFEASVPEPTSIVIWILGLCVAGRMWRRVK